MTGKQKAVKVGQGNARACYEMGVSYAKEGRDDDAISLFGSAIELYRKQLTTAEQFQQLGEAHLYRGILYCKDEDYGKAGSDFEDLYQTLKDSGMIVSDVREDAVAVTEALLSNTGLFGTDFEVTSM